MIKIIQTSILLSLILMMVVFAFFYISFNFEIEFFKPVNESLRDDFIGNFTLRRAFRLSQPGDARSDYFHDNQFTELKVEVYTSSYGTLYDSSADLIKGGVDGALKKPEGIFIEEKEIADVPGQVDDAFIDKLSSSIPRFSKNTAVLRIYILSEYGPHPTLVGLTTNAYGFIIFKKSVEESSTNMSTREDLETETILHEIGHLLGATHSKNKNCVMKEVIDVPNWSRFSFIPTEYCFDDLEAIKDANP